MSTAADTPKPEQPAKPVRRSRKAAAGKAAPTSKAAPTGKRSAAAGRTADRQPERRNLATRPAQLMSREQILQTLHNEHRYMGRIFEAFKEQLLLLQAGQSADYNLMHDVMHYLSSFPERVHHPREEIVFRCLMERDPENKALIEKIFIEHETQVQKGRGVLKLLADIRRAESTDLREQLRIRSEDYLAFHGRHSALEEGKLLPRVEEKLTDDDWVAIAREMAPALNPLDELRGRRYQALNEYIQDRLELAAAEFTLAEFVGMGAFVESIGALSGSAAEIGGVIRRHWRQASAGNRRAWREAWHSKHRRSLRGLLGVTADCTLDNFDHYADGLKEIGEILHRTRRQITEPYVTRLELFNEIEQELESRPL